MTLIILNWWLFSSSFASDMTSICSDSRFLHSSTSTGTKSHSGGHQNSLVLFCYPNWQWVSSSVDWIPPCHGRKLLPSTAGTEKKKKKQRRRLRDSSCLSQGENCVGSRNSHNTSSVLASLWVPLRGTYEAERLIQMILCRLLLSYEHLSSLEVC